MGIKEFASTVKSSFDKSLFNRSSYVQAVNKDTGLYRIEIEPNAGLNELKIVGVLQEPISITMDPEWDVLNLASIVSNFPKIESLFNMAMAPAAAAGMSVNNAGLVTEKFFVKGSYIQIETTFKVVNWEDDGQPLKTAFLLLSLCTPTKRYEATVGEIKDLLVEGLKTAGKKIEKTAGEYFGEGGKEIANNITGFASDTLGGVAKATKDTFNKAEHKLTKEDPKYWNTGMENILDGALMLNSSPPDVSIKIGNYFEHPEMIIENVNVEFSKQMTASGPLFANIKATLSSKTMPVIGGEDKYSNGLRLSGNRILFEGNSKNVIKGE